MENQRAVREVAAGKAFPDPFPAFRQPVEHGGDLVAGDIAEVQEAAEAGVRGAGGEVSGGGEPGIRGDQAVEDGARRQVALAAGLSVEDAWQAEPPGEAEGCGGVAVGERALDAGKGFREGHDAAALQEGPDVGDAWHGEPGEVGEGEVADSGALAPGGPDGRCGRAVPVGDDVDAHGALLTWNHHISAAYQSIGSYNP